jgi:hypothetical protein
MLRRSLVAGILAAGLTTPGSADQRVTLNLPSSYRGARQVTLRSSAPEGLASLDASRITLGGQTVSPAGLPTGTPQSAPVLVEHGSSAVTVAPGTAQIVTFSH